MYVPPLFAEAGPETLAGLMRRHAFALLTTVDADGAPFVSHLPLLYDAEGGPHGTLTGHMAKANPQWQHFAEGRPVLAVFRGPHAYVSPSWYGQQPSVPTWNYAAVHAYGRPVLVEDAEAKAALLRRMVDTYEAGFETPWRMDLPAEYQAGMLKGIVAFRMPVDRLLGKLKLSQNRQPDDRARVEAALAAQGGEPAEVAAEMRALAARGAG